MESDLSPNLLICLASHNGISYIREQIESIFNQKNISIYINVSDDNSSDGTYQYIQNLATSDSRIKVLPSTQSFGSAGRNFYRLIIDSDLSQYDYIAFADQDDIWLPEKLSRHIQLLKLHQADGISSNVLAFWPSGKTKLIKKSQPQRQYDYLFESAGPGCTFLMTSKLLTQVKAVLVKHDLTQQVVLHDWLIYAICRATGHKWIIDPAPSIHYRQHSHNVIGANSGAKAFWSRFVKLTNGWYREEVIKVTQISMTLSQDMELKKIYHSLTTPGIKNRLALLTYVTKARRSLKDRIYLAASFLLGIF